MMLIYRLFGGSINQGVPGQGGNMFDYTGPRGLKVRTLGGLRRYASVGTALCLRFVDLPAGPTGGKLRRKTGRP